MALAIWWLSGHYLGRTPAGMELLPDGDAPGTLALPPSAAPWR